MGRDLAVLIALAEREAFEVYMEKVGVALDDRPAHRVKFLRALVESTEKTYTQEENNG